MRIATWNLNSVRVREGRLLKWLENHQPDILCLQELKGIEEKFPKAQVEALGYRAAILGQKTYNGVAILSRHEITDVVNHLPGAPDEEDPQSRFITVTTAGLRVSSAYIPNGQDLESEKFPYKLAWLKSLSEFMADRSHALPTVLCGDFNCARDSRDIARPAQWGDGVLCHPEVRGHLQAIEAGGMVDTLRLHHGEAGMYSWWDYRGGGFEKDNGLRIDMVYASAQLARRSKKAWIDREERRELKDDKPSDHAPVVADFSWPDSGGGAKKKSNNSGGASKASGPKGQLNLL